MQDVIFQSPKAVYLMAGGIAILLMYIFLYYNRQKRLQLFSDSHLLPYLLVSRSKNIYFVKTAIWVLVWILACFALMSPEGNIRYLPASLSKTKESDQTHEIIFLVDTSASMMATDGRNGQSRLEEAKSLMQHILSQLQMGSVAIYAFTSTLTPLVPQTLDHLFTGLMIRELHVNEGDVGGTRFAPVLEELKSKIALDPLAHAYTIFLFSDGGDNEVYDVNPHSKAAMQSILEQASFLRSLRTKLFVIGLGQLNPSVVPAVTTVEGKQVLSQLQPELLQMLAEQANGHYYTAFEESQGELVAKLVKMIEQDTTSNQLKIAERKVQPISQEDKIADLYYQIPLGIAIILLLGGLLMPEMISK